LCCLDDSQDRIAGIAAAAVIVQRGPIGRAPERRFVFVIVVTPPPSRPGALAAVADQKVREADTLFPDMIGGT
jgi:hypothetical protein